VTALEWLKEHLYGPIDGTACKRAASAIQNHIRVKKWTITSPPVWPKEILHPNDGVSDKPFDGSIRATCCGCKNDFYVAASNMGAVFCCFCGLSMHRIVRNIKKSA
jgi:hypothetical protein